MTKILVTKRVTKNLELNIGDLSLELEGMVEVITLWAEEQNEADWDEVSEEEIEIENARY